MKKFLFFFFFFLKKNSPQKSRIVNSRRAYKSVRGTMGGPVCDVRPVW